MQRHVNPSGGLPTVLDWRAAQVAGELADEVVGAFVAERVGDFIDSQIAVPEQVCRLVQASFLDLNSRKL
jgi:hypothetical protein